MAAVWHWLIREGLYKDLVAATVAVIVGHALTWRPLRRHRRNQEKIADLLDTSTPGGLADVVTAVQPSGPTGKAPR